MTPDELIAETLRLDAEATKGPWSYATWPKTSDGRQSPSIIADGGYGVLACDGPENGPHSRDAEAITVYRTAAPRLARMLRVAIECLVSEEDNPHIGNAKALAEIERIAQEETDGSQR